MNLRTLFELALKVLLGGIFLFGGIEVVRDYNLGAFQQAGFWIVVASLFYWGIVRDTSISSSARAKSIDVGSVVVEFPLRSSGGFGDPEEREQIHAFADALSSAVETSRTGEYDGDEFGASRCRLFFFTSAPDELFTHIEPMLKESGFADGMVATLTRPADDRPYRRIELKSPES